MLERSIDDARKALQTQPFSNLLKAEVVHYASDGVELS